MTPKPIAFRCDPETHERLKELRKELKRETGKYHTYEMMINRLIDDRERLAQARERIAELEQMASRSPREWNDLAMQQERRIAAIRELVTLFTGVARFGDPERITRMLDLHYAEVNGTEDPQMLEAWIRDMPERLDGMHGGE